MKFIVITVLLLAFSSACSEENNEQKASSIIATYNGYNIKESSLNNTLEELESYLSNKNIRLGFNTEKRYFSSISDGFYYSESGTKAAENECITSSFIDTLNEMVSEIGSQVNRESITEGNKVTTKLVQTVDTKIGPFLVQSVTNTSKIKNKLTNELVSDKFKQSIRVTTSSGVQCKLDLDDTYVANISCNVNQFIEEIDKLILNSKLKVRTKLNKHGTCSSLYLYRL